MKSNFFEQYVYLCDTFFISEKTKITNQEIKAEELITPYRIDFMVKLLWLESMDGKYDRERARCLYEAHLLAFSNYLVVEPGQPEKKGLDCYYDSFHRIYSAMSEMEHELVKLGNPIPVDGKGMAMDGAHRISTAIHFKKKIEIYQVDKIISNQYDFLFFRKRCLEEKYIIEMVEKYLSMRVCRLYRIEKDKVSRRQIKKIYKFCAPVYMKKMKTGDYMVLVDCLWIETYRKREVTEQLLGDSYMEEKEEIIGWIEENKAALCAQGRWFQYRKAWKKYTGIGSIYLKVGIKRLIGRTN